MQLNSLVKHVQNEGHALTVHRAKQAQDYLDQGMQELNLAHQEGFADPERLTRAAEALLNAIKFGRTQFEPYLAMAYLCFLLENFQQSAKYLQEVLRLDPNNSDAMQLLEQIIRREREPKQPRIQPVSSVATTKPHPFETQDEPDYDALYDELEEMIIQNVSRISQYPQIRPRPDHKTYQELKNYANELKSLLEQIQSQLRVLEVELETQELESSMKPLQILQQRYMQNLQISKDLQELLQKIESERDLVRSQAQSLSEIESQEDFQVMEENLEALLDETDQIANQIEAFEQKGIHDVSIEKNYEQLVKELEQFQDSLEETPRQW